MSKMSKKKPTPDSDSADPTPATQLAPTIGRIVLFRTPEGQESEVWPAIVSRVEEDGTLVLTVFDGAFGPRVWKATEEGDAPGQWSWPERV